MSQQASEQILHEEGEESGGPSTEFTSVSNAERVRTNHVAVCFVGYPCAGKSVAANVFDDFGCDTIELGDYVREAAIKHHGPRAESNTELISDFAVEERDRAGEGVFAFKAIQDLFSFEGPPTVDGETESVVVIDGIRSPSEVSLFRQAFDKLFVAEIDADFNRRLARFISRADDDASFIAEDGSVDRKIAERQLRKRDQNEGSESGMRDVLSNAVDRTFTNNDTRDMFESKIARFARSLTNA